MSALKENTVIALFRILGMMAAAFLLSSCVQMTLAWADLKPRGEPASPPLLAALEERPAVETLDQWEDSRRPYLQDLLEAHVFGVVPDAARTNVISRRVVDEAAFDGAGRLEEWVLSIDVEFDGQRVSMRDAMGLDGLPVSILLPTDATGPVPVILMETFCPSWDVMPHPGVTRPEDASSMNDGVFGSIATYVFGRYICTPPIEMILSRGYAIATVYPGLAVPDSGEAGLAELSRLSVGHEGDETRWGAIAAWGRLYSRVVDALEEDARFRDDAMVVWGHSRYGKAALFAAAYDARIDGVIAHQSGTGGASLNRKKPGESVSSMTENYPHWFAPRYAAYGGREDAMPVDQHHLLALIAPRPLLLGNARRDVWSDPNGAFRAAQEASKAWALYDRTGLEQDRLDQWLPSAGIAFWIRPGTHGVVEEDWPVFLEFLDVHFQ